MYTKLLQIQAKNCTSLYVCTTTNSAGEYSTSSGKREHQTVGFNGHLLAYVDMYLVLFYHLCVTDRKTESKGLSDAAQGEGCSSPNRDHM